MSDKPVREFRHWKRSAIFADGETKMHFDPTSTNTLSMVKFENGPFIEELNRAGVFIQERSWEPEYEAAIKELIAKMRPPDTDFSQAANSRRKAIRLGNYPPDTWYREIASATLTSAIRRKFPKLMVSDETLRELIAQGLNGRVAAASLYDKENERAAQFDGYTLTRETSKTYRKKSKPPTRQNKQLNRGRPRKK